MLSFGQWAGRVLLSLSRLGNARWAMILGRRIRKNQKSRKSGPSYIRTAERDGRKYVDLDEFVQDREIRRQFKKFAEQAGRR